MLIDAILRHRGAVGGPAAGRRLPGEQTSARWSPWPTGFDRAACRCWSGWVTGGGGRRGRAAGQPARAGRHPGARGPRPLRGGFAPGETREVVMGGPMMGAASLASLDVPVLKGTLGAPRLHRGRGAHSRPSTPASAAGRCVEACHRAISSIRREPGAPGAGRALGRDGEQFFAQDCVECGSCSFLVSVGDSDRPADPGGEGEDPGESGEGP